MLKAVKDKKVKAIDALPKDADEVDAAQVLTAALEHAVTDDMTNGTNQTNATTPKVAEKSAHDLSTRRPRKRRGPTRVSTRARGRISQGSGTRRTPQSVSPSAGRRRPTTTGA